MSGLDPNTGGALVVPGGGGTSLPTASGAGEVPVSDGAGTAYTATTLDEVVVDGMKLALTGEPVGTTLIADGAGDVATTSADVSAVLAAANNAAIIAALGITAGETALPRLSVASALHHWRLDDATTPFADAGSSAVSLAHVAGSREYGRAGVYPRYGATMQRSPTWFPVTDRAEATISDVASGVDITLGVTVANENGSQTTPSVGARIIAGLHDGGTSPRSGILILTNSTGNLYINVAAADGGADIGNVAVDWSRPHRIDVTRVHSTGAVVLYVDGISRATGTVAGTMAALTTASLGSVAQAAPLFTGVSELLMSDLTVHTSALSAADVLSRADVCRRLMVG